MSETLCGSILFFVWLGLPAFSAEPYRPDLLIKGGDKPDEFVGDNVYNSTAPTGSSGSAQAVVVKVVRGDEADVFFRVQNDGTKTDTIVVKGSGQRSGFTLKYFDGSKNITSSVTGSGYQIRLLKRKSKTLRLNLTIRSNARTGTKLNFQLSAGSKLKVAKKDVAIAKVEVLRS